MEKLMEILTNCCPAVDFNAGAKLVTEKIIDSVDLVSIISDIEDAFNVNIDMDRIVPENFDSVEAIWELIQSLQ